MLAGNAPDVFLTSRIDLTSWSRREALQPVSLLLDERGVDFGDRFSRDAVDAFAFADDLQCMAYSVSPMVIYYNDRAHRLRADGAPRARRPDGRDTDGNRDRWTLAEFAAAAQFATRRGDVRGVWIEPTLQRPGALHLLRRR